MSFTLNYNQLRDAMNDFLEDDNQEFMDAQDLIIGRAELKVLKDLDIETSEVVVPSATATAIGVATVVKPTDMIVQRTLSYVKAGVTMYLENKSYEFIQDYGVASGSPLFYADQDETKWLLTPTPDAVYAIDVRMVKRPNGLSNMYPMTWLSSNVPDLLFYACMMAAEVFLKADERVPTWAADYSEALDKAKAELSDLRKRKYP